MSDFANPLNKIQIIAFSAHLGMETNHNDSKARHGYKGLKMKRIILPVFALALMTTATAQKSDTIVQKNNCMRVSIGASYHFINQGHCFDFDLGVFDLCFGFTNKESHNDVYSAYCL